MAIKTDLEKAYDRLNWSFIHDSLSETGMHGNMIEVIMSAIKATSLAINRNGAPTEFFTPTREVRQGDPLSPYFFV